MSLLAERAFIVKKYVIRVLKISTHGGEETDVVKITLENSDLIIKISLDVAAKIKEGSYYKIVCVFEEKYFVTKDIFYMVDSDQNGDSPTSPIINEGPFWERLGRGYDLKSI